MIGYRGRRGRPESQSDDPTKARTAALRHLGRRDFGRAELAARLANQGFTASVIAQIVGELSEEGMLDDARFVHHYVASHAGRGQGPVRISAELRRLGLAEDVIGQALNSGPDWGALAVAARRAKFGAKTPVSWSDKARQARFLQYRGFSSDHIRAATDFEADADKD